jgi:hypothetical protein
MDAETIYYALRRKAQELTESGDVPDEADALLGEAAEALAAS